MRFLLTALLSLGSAQAFAEVDADELLFSAPGEIGRVGTSTLNVEIVGLKVSYAYEDANGETKLKTVSATLTGLSEEGLQALLEQKALKRKLSIVYAPSDVRETDTCLGSDLQYSRVEEDAEGQKSTVKFCYEVSPEEVVLH